jgi:diaminohydroxyphosphoribosylaminopyrimidine deaminase/5-amino-6-(5-phosphoribosylamino)uracil reductase
VSAPDDDRFMAVAVAMAHRALGTTAPNPAVGAVVVRDGVVLGAGFTRPVGGPHAEVEALAAARAAGHDPAGATLYVTLEPGRHFGRTPPCTDALLAAGIQRVVVGVVDPNPLMCGRSLELLREAGVEVALGVGAESCARLVLGFGRAITRGLPEVVCKVAMSLDGRIATASGESKWITGAAARAHGAAERRLFDAILVGAGTVRADDPRLTARGADGADYGVQPVPVVVSGSLDLPPEAAVFRHPRRALVFGRADAHDPGLPAEVVRVDGASGGVDLDQVLRALAARGLHRVWVEGGGRVVRSLIDAGRVDELRVYVAGTVLPGGLPWLGGPPVGSLADAPRFGAPSVELVGDDVLLRYRVAREP